MKDRSLAWLADRIGLRVDVPVGATVPPPVPVAEATAGPSDTAAVAPPASGGGQTTDLDSLLPLLAPPSRLPAKVDGGPVLWVRGPRAYVQPALPEEEEDVRIGGTHRALLEDF